MRLRASVAVGSVKVNGLEVMGSYKKTIEINPVRVGLVGCSSQKALGAAPAKDLYGSALFRAARAYVERTCSRWYILSAKYGVLEPGRVIAPYDMKMQRSGAAKWGRLVGEQLDAQIPELDAELIVLAGERYVDPINIVDREFYWSEPLRGLGIGERIAWLNKNTPGAA
jgi:hypothetical protein